MKTFIAKTIVLITVFGFISYSAMAQFSKEIPQAAKTAFAAKYPQAELKKWKTDKDTAIAVYMQDGKKWEASFDKNGAWLRTERSIKHESSLPPEAMSYLKTSTYASWHIDDITKVNTPTVDMYRVYVDNHSGSPFSYESGGAAIDRVLSFDVNGKLVKVQNL
jgi:hypothetical protein